METSKRQVTIIDELWDNEQSNANRRLYDEQGRALQRQNIELNDRLKRFERQLEVLKHDQPKEPEKDLVRRALSKQAHEYKKLLAKKDEQIEGLNERVQQLSQSNHLESALRQSNIEKLHLEKRLLSSTSSLNSTTTTTAGPTTTSTSTATAEEQSNDTKNSSSSVDSIHHQAVMQKTNEMLRAEIHRLTQSNEDNVAKLELQVKQFEELQTKYKRLLDQDEHARKDKHILDAAAVHENEELKEKIHALEAELLTMKSTQSHHQDLQINIERLQTEVQLSIKERETVSMLNTQLHNEISNLTSTNERITDECEKLRAALIAKSDEYELKERENTQLKTKTNDLESTIRSLRDTNDLQRRLNEENEQNKQELKRKQDDFEQFQKMHDATKREHQSTIRSLQDKIHDLERKTELQSLKHEEILLQFESLKKRSDRILPSSTDVAQSHSSTSKSSRSPPTDDSAPINSHQPSPKIESRSAQIVVAKYSYEPLKFSPNDHPEIELPLKLGEYYLVYGDIDEDGFYDGRNLQGRYGLIPSNFIELVSNPSDLPEHTKESIQKFTGKIIPTNERIVHQRERTLSIDSDVFTNNTSIPAVKTNSVTSDQSTDDHSYGKHIPSPTHLRIEKCLVTVFSSLESSGFNAQILGYQVLFDHALYTTIPVNERTRALVENINLNDKPHRIAIRTITQHGLSRDQHCTLLFTNSKDLVNMPTDLRVDRIAATTAVVSWWPASNELVHKLYVNDIEVQTLKAGTYRFKLSGLLPNTMHKVTIRAKPVTATTLQQQLVASMEFRTAAFDESIQPPRRIQAIPGPQLNTLLVSWEQLSSTSTTRGYRVLIDGRQVQDVTNPSNDHTLLNLKTAYPGRYLTVRTLTTNGGESNDSTPIDLDDILKKTSRPLPTIPQDLSNGKEMTKSLTRSLVESPSTSSSLSTDVPQIDLRASIPRTGGTRLPSSDANRNRTPTNENLHMTKSISPDDQRSTMQSSAGINEKTNASPRLFIALFDYDPHAMSPNQDSEEELPFKKGQIIQIFGEQDGDGFFIGQTDNGRTGFVPSNMVSEMPVDQSETKSPATLPSSTQAATASKKMIALFDYNPKANSPNDNPTDELTFHAGDIIHVRENVDDDGFYFGELANGKQGLVPSNYLKEMSEEKESEKKEPSVNVKDDIEPPPSSFLNRLKSTLTWNSNEPI